MPFSLPSPFSITRFNFFCLQVLLTRASLLAVAKSIYYSFYRLEAGFRSVPRPAVYDMENLGYKFVVTTYILQTNPL